MDPYIGEIRLVAFNYVPDGWLACNGQQLNLSQYQALYAIIGTIYGGDGASNFNLPNLNGRGLVGYGKTYPVGLKAGAVAATLTPATMPAHTHQAVFSATKAPTFKASVAVSTVQGTQKSPANAFLAPSVKGTTPCNSYNATSTGSAVLGGIQASGNASGTVTVAPQGSQAPMPFGTLPPVMYLNYIISYVGLFPNRP